MNLLLEQKGAETTVEGSEALLLEDTAEATDKAVGELGVGDQTDTGGLKRAESQVGEELGAGGGGEVDSGAVVGGRLVAEEANGLLLEELVTTELQGTLEEVTSEGRAGTSEERAGALLLDDLLEAADEAAVVGLGVELDASLDAVAGVLVSCACARMLRNRLWCDSLHIDGGKATVGEGAADGTGEGETGVELDAGELRRLSGLDVLLDGIDLGAAGGGGGSLGGHCDGNVRSGDVV